MKNIKSIEEFLFESKSSAKKRFLDRGLISEEDFNSLLLIDTTPTKKYIEKMCEFFVDGETLVKINDLFIQVISLKINFDISQINYTSDLETLIFQRKQKMTRSEKDLIAQQGAEVTYEDDRFLVLYITTEEASKKYGKGTKWCISAENDCAWNMYYPSSNFYFIIDSKSENEDFNKLSVEFKVNKNKVVIWNNKDNDIENSTIATMDYLNSLNLPKNVFKYHNIDKFEDVTFKDAYGIVGRYSIREDGKIDVYGGVNLRKRGLVKIPLDFGEVAGDFDCSGNYLTSLVGCPVYVRQDFWCSENHLSSLEGSPKRVGGRFDCSNNHLTSLKYISEYVTRLDCSINNLKTLDYIPDSVKSIDCYKNKLYTLKGLPTYLSDGLDCSNNNLETLEYSPIYIGGNFDCSLNEILSSLEGSPKEIIGNFVCKNNPRLYSIEHSPENVGGDYILLNVGNSFSKNEIREVCQVGGIIEVN